MSTLVTQRLDKWLWAARFYKTRKLATDAINSGKIQLNGQRTKASKDVKINSRILIHKEPYNWDITVLGLNNQRRPASEAALLYQESDISIQKRQQEAKKYREQRQFLPLAPSERPNKKQRRKIHQFKQMQEN